ncbi:MAG: 23S rRNA (pseudouridine(1915)-N(3))-methyltransferase RlmH [Lachnospiraceae bacterium]|nr:23S rRNA (pseudouridine(1915)-N(3))-methyltransferase RlmH [Lachnospiraceae bacterium]
MNIKIITVGKIKEKFYRDAILEYSKRLSSYCKLNIIEVNDEMTKENASVNEVNIVLRKEGERILKSINNNEYIIALAINGKKLDSIEFANKINDLRIHSNSNICFIIGGSLGLSDDVLKKANMKLSFSDMTFPHQLMRVILLEQIYRAFRINNNEPYHK